MNLEFCDGAREYAQEVSRAFAAAGGDDLLRRAEQDPLGREALVVPVLDKLGAFDLDPRAGAEELEATAVLCRCAGWWGVPYPVAEHIAGVVVDESRPQAAVGGLGRSWRVFTLSGQVGEGRARPLDAPPRSSWFVAELDVVASGRASGAEVALALVLPCFTLLGMLDRALSLTRSHVTQRHQFGQPLAEFQGVQFQLTDAEVERAGCEELAKYALWSVRATPDDAVADALALRCATLEAADVVFRVAHQLHGALGFCDESPLSWLSRYSQPLRRLPFGLSASRAALAEKLGSRPLRGLYDAAYASEELRRLRGG